MPKYRFKALDLSNRVIKGTFIAKDDNDFKNIMSNQNYFLISYHKTPDSVKLSSILGGINIRDFTVFCNQFAILINAGMSIERSVFILKSSTSNGKLKKILEVVYSDLLKGVMLSDAFARYPKTFPLFFRNMVAIGETSGKLELVFTRLAEYYEKDAATKRKVKSALAYPIFLLVLAFGALAVISFVVMPQFSGMFAEFGADLPMISQMVINTSAFIKDNFLQLLGIIGLIIVLIFLLTRLKSVKRIMDNVKLNFPFVRSLMIANVTARFCNGFSVLLSSGMLLIESLDSICRLLGNQIVEEKILIVKREVSSGKSLASSMETINLFPKMLIEMIAVGEETASLEEVLNRTTKYFDEQVDDEIKKMTSSIGPLMLLVIGGIVIVVLLAIFLPMLGLMEAIEGSSVEM